MMAGVATACECEEAVRRGGAGVPPRREGHQRGAHDVGVGAEEFFGAGEARIPAAHAILWLADVGLGYLSLGQPLTTLSGGRAAQAGRPDAGEGPGGSSSVYVLDEPTSGLHLADVEQLLDLLDRLVDAGLSVIVIEHHQAVMARRLDHRPRLGRRPRRQPDRLRHARRPRRRPLHLTGEHLAAYVGG
jgi:hypothetical protein